MNADPAVAMAAELMYQQKMPSGEEVKLVVLLLFDARSIARCLHGLFSQEAAYFVCT